MDKDLALLRETDLFKNLNELQIGKILKIARKISIPSGEVIMKEGDLGGTMYIILEGAVDVVKSLVMNGVDDDEGGRNKLFTRLEAQEHGVFGEIAMLEEMKRTATVRAVTNCLLYEIERSDFLRIAEEDYELGYRILLNLSRIVSARLRRADEDTIKLTTALSLILKES